VTVKTPISKSVPGDPVNLVSDTNAVDLLPSPTVDNIDANLDNGHNASKPALEFQHFPVAKKRSRYTDFVTPSG
jgi:hypothetical protein